MSNTVVITGASRGIGKTSTEYLLSKGYKVYAICRNSADCDDFRQSYGDQIATLQLDLRNIYDFDAVVSQINEQIDALLHIAGLYHNDSKHFFDTQFGDWNEKDISDAIDVGLKAGMILATKLSTKIKENGCIINMSGTFDPDETGVMLDFVVKNALEMFTKYAARELKSKHIRVNAVRPWFVNTESVRKFFPNVSTSVLIDPLEIARTFEQIIEGNQNGEIIEVRK